MGFEIDDDLINEDLINEDIWPELRLVERRSRLNALVVGAMFGAMAAYFFDPVQGRGRRVQLRDQAGRLIRDSIWLADKKRRHLSHIIGGIPYRLKRRFDHETVDDRRLVSRIRAEIGRVTRHPGAIEVSARDGRVTLQGPILASEITQVFRCVRAVPGVQHVVNALTPHVNSRRIPALQGEGKSYLNP